VHRVVLRDLLLLAFVPVSIGMFGLWPYLDHAWSRAAVGGLAVYRAVDVALTLAGLGVFGSLRHGATLEELPRHRIQRTMIALLLNYLELMVWFAVLYVWIGTTDPGQFELPVSGRREAFFVSMETFTTIGYGRHAPVKTRALVFCTAQAVLALLILAIVIGGLVGSLREAGREVEERPLTGRARYTVHALTPLAAYAGCVALAYFAIGV
jgi:hypothetical protein